MLFTMIYIQSYTHSTEVKGHVLFLDKHIKQTQSHVGVSPVEPNQPVQTQALLFMSR